MFGYVDVHWQLPINTRLHYMISKLILKLTQNSRKPANSLEWTWIRMKTNIASKCIYRILQKWWMSEWSWTIFFWKLFLVLNGKNCNLFFFLSFRNQFTVIPILVGSISLEVEATYGELLAPYLADSQNLFVISSDFCHWGKRFSYTYYDESCGPIHKSIEKLDKNVCCYRWFPFFFRVIDFIYNEFSWFIDNFTLNSGYGFNRNIESRGLQWLFETLQQYDLWTSSDWCNVTGIYRPIVIEIFQLFWCLSFVSYCRRFKHYKNAAIEWTSNFWNMIKVVNVSTWLIQVLVMHLDR